MSDTTQPAAAVESLSEGALEGTLESLFGDQPEGKPRPAPQEAAEPETEAPADQPSDELSPDDVPDEEQAEAPADDAQAFEIVHNGQTVKLSRAEMIENARKGFDYTQKTQIVAEKQRQVDAVLQRSQALAQIAPLMTQELATVKAFESQLQQYSNVDWVRLATEEPLEYPKYRAQYDALVQGYQQASGQLQQKAQAVVQEQQAIAQWKLQTEAQALVERIPEWRDPQKYQAGAQELASYLIRQGANPAVVGSLDDSLAVAIARKAMLYDKLVEAKAAKSKQVRNAPPVVRPGAAQSDPGRQNFTKVRTEIRRAGAQGNHKAQENALLGLLNKTFKK